MKKNLSFKARLFQTCRSCISIFMIILMCLTLLPARSAEAASGTYNSYSGWTILASVSDMRSFSQGLYASSNSSSQWKFHDTKGGDTYKPHAGDIIVYGQKNDTEYYDGVQIGIQHVEICVGDCDSSGYYTVIEGNAGTNLYPDSEYYLGSQVVQSKKKWSDYTGTSLYNANKRVIWNIWECTKDYQSYNIVYTAEQELATYKKNPWNYRQMIFKYQGERNWCDIFVAHVLMTTVEDPTGKILIKKSSSDTSISGSDSDYTLAGAVYTLYSDKACKTSVGTLTINSNNQSYYKAFAKGTYYVKETTAPKGYKLDTTVYTVSIPGGMNAITLSVKDTPIPKRTIQLTKTSANTACTANNSCYSLKGAVYGVYSDSTCKTLVTKLTTDANGKASVKIFEGKYYVKEITAPAGYALDKTVYTADISAKDVALNVKDQPVNDPAGITLSKIDKDSKQAVPSGAASLEGAQFEVLYYAGYYTKDNLPETPTRRWVYETKKYTNEQTGNTIYSWELGNAETLVEGDDLYLDSSNRAYLPLGTVMIREIKAPEGYLIEDAVYTTTDGEEVEMPYVAQVTQNGDVAYLQGGNVPVVKEQVERGDFFLKKTDEEGNALAGVEFIVTNTDTKESHTITTDENGYFSSKAEYAESTGTERLWFGSEETNDEVGALPYGNYTIEEVHGTSNRGLTMESKSFSIDANNAEVDLSMTNKEPTFSISTKATNKLTGLQTAKATADIVLSDTITLTNVYLWDSAAIKVWAVDKETGEKIKDAKGNDIIASKEVTFEYDTENPTTDVTLDLNFDYSNLNGKVIVFFSEVTVTDRSGNSRIVCEGKDVNDADETISFENYVYVNLTKSSAKTDFTDGNSCYSLKDAIYGIYSDKECTVPVKLFTTDETGKTSVGLYAGNYYVKEITAPKGYTVDTTVYSISADSEIVNLNIKEQPVTASANISLSKIDKDTGLATPLGAASLEGAQFEVLFYAGSYTKDNLPETSTKRWVYKTKVVIDDETGKTEYKWSFGDTSCFVEGDKLYTDANGDPCLPLGTVAIRETKASEGYLTKGAVYTITGNEESELPYIVQIKQDGDSAKIDGNNLLTVKDQVQRGDFFLKKTDTNKTALADVEFIVTNTDTKESHTIKTDENGYFSSTATYAAENNLDRVWFGSESANKDLGALPYGNYTIEEVHGSSNRGLMMQSKEFKVEENSVTLDLSMANEEPEFSLSSKASNKLTGLQTAKAYDENLVLSDTITLTNVYLWDNATVKAWAVDKTTGEKLRDANGRYIETSKDVTFEYDAENTTTDVVLDFDFDFSNLEGTNIVFFSEVSVTDRTGKERVLCEGKNLNDAAETIQFERSISLTKTSSNTDCSGNNSCYSLENAVYGVYSDAKCTELVTKLTTDKLGWAVTYLDADKYYIKEITSPTGYAIDTTVYTADLTSGSKSFKLAEQPVSTSADITLSKVDKDSGLATPSGAASLEGAKFDVLYYAGYYTKGNLPEVPTRRWVYETKAVVDKESDNTEYRWSFGDTDCFVEGDAFYMDKDGNAYLPLGTIVIRETKASEGYLTEGAVYTTTENEESELPYIVQIKQDGDSAKIDGSNLLTVKDQVQRGDFFLKKTDTSKTALANVEFIVTNTDTKESHTIKTDKNGYFSSKAEYASQSASERLWFGSEKTNDKVGALPYGNYTIEEVRGSSNRGLIMQSKGFKISENGEEIDLSMTNEEPEFSISTKATNKLTGLQTAKATDNDLVLSDTVTLTNVFLWDSATVKVWAVDKKTGEKIKDAKGNYIEMSKNATFKYDTEKPTTDVIFDFDFDFSNLEGVDLVFFSEVTVTDRTGKDRLLCESKDINDNNETIRFEKNINLVKTSAVSNCTDENSCYSLKDAVYGIYSDKECTFLVKLLTTDEKGRANTSLYSDTYYVKEITAPKGYATDTKVYTIPDTSGTVTLNIEEQPVSNSTGIILSKVDKDSGLATPLGAASLEGAQFEVLFYAGYYTKDNLPESPARKWIYETKAVTDKETGKTEYKWSFGDNDSFIEGDTFYTDASGQICLPLGTIVIREVKASEGYLTDGAVYISTDGNEAELPYIAQITQDENAAILQGGNSLTVKDQVERGDFFLKKTDTNKTALANVEFIVTNTDTKESHTIKTDENGYFSTKAEYATQSDSKRLWFGSEETSDEAGALPYGNYTIEEIHGTSNRGLIMQSKDFKIAENGVELDLSMTNEEPEFSLATKAKNTLNGLRVAMSSADGLVLSDTITLTNVYLWNNATIKAWAVDKETGKELKDAKGNYIEVSKDISFNYDPKNPKTEITLNFDFDFSNLKEKDIVFYSEVHVTDRNGNDRIICEGKDINDIAETIQFERSINLIKTSANKECTDNNSCYSLEGAVYGVYSDKACTELLTRLTTDKTGTASVDLYVGTYFVKEISAPAGYMLDTAVYTADITSTSVTLNLSDNPVESTEDFVLSKIDKDSGLAAPSGAASLEGAQFEVLYYAGHYTKDNLPETSTRRWVYETKAVNNKESGNTEYKWSFGDNDCFVEGDEFYTNKEGNTYLPLGTLVIREIKASEGYLTDKSVYVTADGEEIEMPYITHILQSGDTAYLEGGTSTTVKEQVQRGDFHLTKTDIYEKALADVEFIITSKDTKESHTFRTDKDGYFSSTAAYAKNIKAERLWFGSEKTNADVGALPYGNYTIEEVHGSSNRGLIMQSKDFKISENGAELDLSMKNQEPEYKISTKAANTLNGQRVAMSSDEDLVLSDTVTLTNVYLWNNATIKAWAVDKKTGEKLKDAKGNYIEVSKNIDFTYDTLNPETVITLNFDFDFSNLKEKDIVFYSEVHVTDRNGNDRIICEGKDINDIAETIQFERSINLIKTSANKECTDDNSCYSLEGAVYGVYSDKACTELLTRLTTDKTGTASVDLYVGTYYVKEISAPTGYILDTNVYLADITSTSVTLNLSDNPVESTEAFVLSKIDKDSGLAAPSGAASLEGAQFEVLYYAGYYTKENLPETPTKRWVYKTKSVIDDATGKSEYKWSFEDTSCFIEGDDFYIDANGRTYLPLGTIMIREIKAPEGYLIEDAVYTSTDGEEVEMPYVAQVTQNGDVAYLQGGNVPVVKEQVERGDFFLKKTDDEGNALAGVKFIITSVETGESHTITTDENGYFSSKAEYAESTGTERLWFGSEETNDEVGALPYGNYTIEEVHGASNRGLTMKSGSFTIDENDIELDLSMTNEAPEFTLTTKAVNKLNGLQVATATDKDLVLSDTITLTNVYLWDSAKIKVWAVDKETGKKITDATGEYIEMTEDVDFEYDTEDPTIEIEVDFDFDFSNLEGKDIVFFSEAIVTDRNGEEKVICEGKDINDVAETIRFAGIGTTAKDKKDGDTTLDLSKKATITDTVAYKGLKAGTKYKLEGVLMDKSTGKAVIIDGKKVTASKIFTAKKSSGKTKVKFSVDTTELAGKTIVVFERLYEIPEGKEDISVNNKTTPTASHEDINSVDQTLKVVEKTPTTGDTNNAMPYILLIAGSGFIVIVGAIGKSRKR